MTVEPKHVFEIKAYIVQQNQISNINSYLKNPLPIDIYFDQGLRVGKAYIKKEQIKNYYVQNNENCLYIVVQKKLQIVMLFILM